MAITVEEKEAIFMKQAFPDLSELLDETLSLSDSVINIENIETEEDMRKALFK